MKGKIPFVRDRHRRHRHLGGRAGGGDRPVHHRCGGTRTRTTRRRKKPSPPTYQKKYGKPAADKAWMGWIAAKSLFESIEAAKSTETDADHRGAGKLEVRQRGQSATSYRKWRPPDAAAQPGGAGEGQDHRQVGLLRRQRRRCRRIPPIWTRCSASPEMAQLAVTHAPDRRPDRCLDRSILSQDGQPGSCSAASTC